MNKQDLRTTADKVMDNIIVFGIASIIVYFITWMACILINHHISNQ